ncbi:MAG: 5-methyltetrahydropteroyltriglutamate--homocysteine S-methyltransferase [Betaproteobacteria bacterium]|nr:5-methyltetrahydropteroyltriglutamate--homocysteine S-methyltransferase [Betaproteobacteria bacterium]
MRGEEGTAASSPRSKTPRPPYRADQVGSLLRPPELKEARAKAERGELPAQALRALEDRLIREAVARQEGIGLEVVTDGEFRRGWWNHDFLGRIGGVEIMVDQKSVKFVGSDDPRYTPQVRGKLRRNQPMMLDHFRYLHSVATKTAKFCMPSPSILYHRGGRAAVSREVYPDMEEFWADAGRVYGEEIRDLAASGCRYIQIDDTSFSFMCDDKFRASCLARGDDPDTLPLTYARAVNAAIAERPADMTIVMHTCRGNWKSTWLAEGGYEPVAETVFNETKVDGFFLEYDSDRAGSFAPLRFVPRGKKVVLGLVSTKTPVLEDRGEIKRRIEEAAKYVPLEDLCLSPQCGFASSHHGNQLSQDDQWRKLELVVEVAREVWNGA